MSVKLDLQTVLESRNSLSAFPPVVTELLRRLDDPDTTPAQFQEIILKDPLITAKTLKLANSAYYGHPRAVTTISEAVILLGLETLRSLVIAISAYNVLNREVRGYRYEAEDFWKHSLTTALIARGMRRLRGRKDEESFFVGGILHDIGKLLLDHHREAHYDTIEEFSRSRRVPVYLAEKAILGHNHAEIGAALAEVWGFPPTLVETIRHHHTPLSASPRVADLVKTLYWADIVSNRTLGRPAEVPNPVVGRELGLTAEEERRLAEEASREFDSFMAELRKE